MTIKLDIKSDMDRAMREVGSFYKKQVPYAAWLAQKNTAFKVRKAGQNHMGRVFKTVSRYTRSAPIVEFQSYSQWRNGVERSAAVNLIGQYRGKKGSRLRERHYLWDHIHGERTPTGFEMRLQRAGIIGAGTRVVKTRYLMVYAKGRKVPKGIYQKILSQLSASGGGLGAGYNANATNSRRSRAKRRGQTFFVQKKGSVKGIWMRFNTRGGRMAVPVFIFVDSTRYKKRFRFYQVSHGAARKHWPIEFNKALTRAIKTAK